MTDANGVMSATENATSLHDRDLDLPRASGRRRAGGLSVERYQRLVANPFLALSGFIGWFALMRFVLGSHRIELFFPALSSLLLLAFLFQYHCLDCGATGHLSRWRGHCCAAVDARRGTGRPRRVRGPSPPTQTVLWIGSLTLAAFYGYLISR
jgi:hypothetical protein